MKGHQFALWSPDLSSEKIIINQHYCITHKELIVRITAILRLRVGETCILFDRILNVQLQIVSIESKRILTMAIAINKNVQHIPYITVLLPLLKRDDLCSAVADLTAVGVSVIQLVMTETVQRVWGGQQEKDRLERVMVAAAEQSKNFALPVLKEPQQLVVEAARQKMLLYGELDGDSLKSVLNSMPAVLSECSLLVGPESDLSDSEKKSLQNANAIACVLTPTVLRAHLAITVMAACVRSWYHKV